MSNLTLVGSPSRKLPQELYKLKSAEITNTRLMGVLGMHVYWKAEDSEELRAYYEEKGMGDEDFITEYHQIFYYEIEENGLP